MKISISYFSMRETIIRDKDQLELKLASADHIESVFLRTNIAALTARLEATDRVIAIQVVHRLIPVIRQLKGL